MTEFPTDGTTDATYLRELQGAELDAALDRRFQIAEEAVEVGAHRFVLRKPANADHLISEADYVLDERLPYWADLWPSARQLAATILAERGEGRTLLELGCGLGLDTTAALQAGFDVTATDYYEDALHVTRANAARNIGREPTVRLVDWRHWPSDLGRFDVVMAADVIYEAEYATLVAQCIARSLAPHGEAIIADPGRIALPQFFDELPANGLSVSRVEKIGLRDGELVKQIQIIRLTHA